MTHLDRIAAANYEPIRADVLRALPHTTGIVESVAQPVVPGRNIHKVLRILDVGGSRSGRRIWASIFERLELVFYVASLTDYSEVLFYDQSTNRLHDSLEVFHELCHSRWLARTPVVLLLTHYDALPEVLETTPLDTPTGPLSTRADVDAACEFIAGQFHAAAERSSVPVFLTRQTPSPLREFCMNQATQRHNLELAKLPNHVKAEVLARRQGQGGGSPESRLLHTYILNALDERCMRQLKDILLRTELIF
eukprot:TRINITY_DN1366_c0_g1_i2.p1 TRINITY_DN1366_c0_g1~~TRINITY_DN1366_c0_g1_i2.p1  ORF type:complete len:251 (+),score=29.35 TRINITY_DN1366_c0_g1_i2:549-1301(+)